MVFLWGALKVPGWVLAGGWAEGLSICLSPSCPLLRCRAYIMSVSLLFALTAHRGHISVTLPCFWCFLCGFPQHATHLPLDGHIAWITINLSAHMDGHASHPSLHAVQIFFCYLSTSPPPLCFSPVRKNKNAGRGWGEDKILLKIHSRMPMLSLTDLCQFGKRHFLSFFVQVCQSWANGSNW